MLGLIASRFGIPRVIAYLLVGVLFSEGFLGGVLEFNLAKVADVPTVGALGIIAYIIGGSITMAQIHRVGKIIFGTAIGESLGAILLVLILLPIFFPSFTDVGAFQLALPMAAIAATTAPAATLAVLHQYRASGPMTDTLLGVVAVDDALGIIFYSLALALVTGGNVTSHIGLAFWEIFGASLFGGLSGFFLAKLGHHIRQSGLRLPLVLGGIFMVIGWAEALNFSPILATLVLGFSSRYFLKAAADRLFAPIEFLEELVFLIFFTMAGAHFQYSIIVEYLDLVFIYFIARIVGKLFGAYLGANISGAPPNVSRWIGFGLVPQAGVAVGLALTLSQEAAFQSVAPMIINVILGATLLYEIFGPFAVRFALHRVGETGVKRLSLRE